MAFQKLVFKKSCRKFSVEPKTKFGLESTYFKKQDNFDVNMGSDFGHEHKKAKLQ